MMSEIISKDFRLVASEASETKHRRATEHTEQSEENSEL